MVEVQLRDHVNEARWRRIVRLSLLHYIDSLLALISVHQDLGEAVSIDENKIITYCLASFCIQFF